ncbi:MAG TPA: hypothetical protein DEQ80_09265 [Anaerolinea thermolimosa]|uniref:Firmicu-CTERM sorting domain-containing protein n=1 Tax=Anaerolinea thermolimosa TaxID=229919 RepID=A0A3D1JII2_9CHLR|nr:hypothetical protein [Anaerolinea thermolimosa]GAP07143.1 hypothetical protein ATHL_02011 [Anaerolinea thermolimosa]HCE18035.1 hypothetical protein [Anaerolinea thermolimosa]
MNRQTKGKRFSLVIIFIIWASLISPGAVKAAADIILDGAFGDWAGQICIPDPAGDAASQESDLLNFCFANNPDDPTAYFMVERPNSKGWMEIWLYLDTNNNGLYQEATDRRVRVSYKPQGNHSSVDVSLYTGSGNFIGNIATGMDWGESMHDNGGRVEWGVSLDSLGLQAGQPIRMFVQTMLGGTISDSTVEVQWSPANALGIPILAGILLVGSAWFVYQRQSVRA